MDKLSAMRTFVRVVEAGTFTKAADSLGVGKAQVTREMQSLEEDLRTLLLHRTTRRMTVTPDGAAYYERVTRVLDEIDEIEAGMAQTRLNPKGRLRIDVMSPVANLLIVPALPDFCARYPDIEIDLGVNDRPVDLIADNVDCVLRAGEVKDQSLVARRVGEITRVLCASPAYLKRVGVPREPSDLEADPQRVITYFPRGSERVNYVLRRGDERHELHARSTVAVSDSSTLLAAALAGLGVSLSTTFMVQPHLADGSLRLVLPEWSAGVVPLYAVYPPNRHVSAKLRVFIDWVVELFERKQLEQPGAVAVPRQAGGKQPTAAPSRASAA